MGISERFRGNRREKDVARWTRTRSCSSTKPNHRSKESRSTDKEQSKQAGCRQRRDCVSAPFPASLAQGHGSVASALPIPMRHRWISAGCWFAAAAISLILAACALRWGSFLALQIVSGLWVIVDSGRIEFRRYRCGVGDRPNAVFATLLLLGWPIGWLIVFPWYLATRFRIMAGVARLRGEYDPESPEFHQVEPSGLLQPWRRRV
jgi:hypothetical protein